MSSSLLANYYHMQHMRDLHDVTVCIFHSRTTEDPKFLKRLEGLQATIQTIDHEGVPKIRDCAELNGRHCMFMDAVEGQTLSEYFVAQKQSEQSGVGVEATTLIMARLLGLLGSAHARGVDHRDLDTDLIFVKADGSLQVLGLGVKATLGIELFEAIVSASVSPLVASDVPTRLNSFDVMSPEYRAGVVEDLRVDLYGAGYIAYWLLTGSKVDLSSYQAPSTRILGLPTSWDTLLEKALQRRSQDRYQTCKGALVDLKATEKEPESVKAGMIQRQIDCLPVPKGIVERGELASRIYRLSVIGVIGVTLTALVASLVHSIFDGEWNAANTASAPMAVQATEGAAPNLSLTLLPADAQVRVEGVRGAFRAQSGTLDLVVQPGTYQIRVAASQHVDQLLTVEIEQGAALSTLDVQLAEQLADLEIRTDPEATLFGLNQEGAEVALGRADAEGRFVFKRSEFSDTQRIAVRKEGYSAQIVEDLSGESVEVALVELPTGVTVRTQPEGARVFVNDVDVGRSPVTVNVPARDGGYQITAVHAGYRPVERRIVLELGEHEVIDFGELLECTAALDFSVTFAQTPESEVAQLMRELVVDLDGAPVALDAAELQVVPEGVHVVGLRHPMYTSDLQSITVVDREDQTLTYVMRPLPGRIALKLPEAVEVDVRVDTVSVDMVEHEIAVGVNQPVEVELRMKDHLTMMRRFELKPDQRVVWEVTPVPIPGPEFGQDWTMPYHALKLSWIDAGHFSMGSPMREAGRLPNEGPLTEVQWTRGFWAGSYEVTQAQYFQIMEVNPSSVVDANLPVNSVTWEDAQDYCQRLTNQEQAAGRLPDGYVYRLPTEAEWEYAARGGTVLPFAFGDEADPSDGNFQGIYPGNLAYESKVSEHYGSLPVGSYAPNAYGLYDAHGNVAEWTLDRYNGRHRGGAHVDPEPRDDGRRVAVRGGSWEDFSVRARSAARAEVRPDMKSNSIGFRVVLAPEF
jgi:formylglycine-generating enzyme required for sulfatase activity